MKVIDQKWFKDQMRLYGLLYDLSKLALEDLDSISKAEGFQDISLTDKELKKRQSTVRQIRAIFRKLDPVHTQVS